MYRNKDQIEKELASCMNDLKDVAMADGQISHDEKAILDQIENDFINLEKQLFQVLESDLQDHEFDDLVMDFLQDVIKDVISVAKKDGKITSDEQRLIRKIEEFVLKEGKNNDK